MNEAVEKYIFNLQNEQQKRLMQFLHQLLLSFPNITSKMRFKIPFYDGIKWICYLNPIKNNGVEVCFLNGFKLSNSHNLLQAKKRVMVKGISIYTIETTFIEQLVETINEAIMIDEDNKKLKFNKTYTAIIHP